MVDRSDSYGFRPAILPLVWILTTIAFLIVVARIVTKKFKLNGPTWEDHLMIVAMVLAIFFGIVTTFLYDLGLGLKDKSLFQIPDLARYFYVGHVVGFVSPAFARTSFCLYMVRVLGSDSASKRYILWTVVSVQWIVNLVMAIVVLCQCGTYFALWRGGLGEERPASCISHVIIGGMAVWTTSFNAFTDVFLTILPAVVVWRIKAMHPRTKIGIVATLGLSLFASAASICKAYFTWVLYFTEATPKILAQVYIVMAVEVNVVIIVASLPILAPLLLHRKGRVSSYQTPVLPEYESSTSKDASVTVKSAASRWVPRKTSGPAREDSACATSLGSAISEREKYAEFSVKNQSSKIVKVVDIAIASEETGQEVFDEHIVPQCLQAGCSRSLCSDHVDVVASGSSPQTWEDMPTLTFLRHDE